jgi:acetylornithine deacetylase
MIANEESASEMGVGIDVMQERGELDFLKAGPVFWVDSANFGPTIGTGGMACWSLTAIGKKFHSGFPNKAINPIPLAFLALRAIQERFYRDFAMEPAAKEYLYQVGSSLKPTQLSMVPSSINQIPQTITISGDIRLTPFWPMAEVKKKVESYVAELDVAQLRDSCAYSSFDLPDEKLKGQIQWRWQGEGMEGVACNLKSPGYAAICEALNKVTGKVEPFSLTGSLPIIRNLFNAGYDVQITGFGRLDAYHANNEFALLSDFHKGFQVCSHIVQYLEYGL